MFGCWMFVADVVPRLLLLMVVGRCWLLCVLLNAFRCWRCWLMLGLFGDCVCR